MATISIVQVVVDPDDRYLSWGGRIGRPKQHLQSIHSLTSTRRVGVGKILIEHGLGIWVWVG